MDKYRIVGGPPLSVAGREVRSGGTFSGSELADPDLLELLLASGQVIALAGAYDDVAMTADLDPLVSEVLTGEKASDGGDDTPKDDDAAGGADSAASEDDNVTAGAQ